MLTTNSTDKMYRNSIHRAREDVLARTSEFNVYFAVRGAVKATCEMLMALGIKTRTVYEENFEQPFLEVSGEFFKVCHQSFELIQLGYTGI